MERILLRTVDAASESKDPARLRGAYVRERHTFRGKDSPVYGLPEFGPPRLYYDGSRLIHRDGVVIPMGGRLYRVRFIPVSDNGGVPEGGTVEFIPTTDPETYYLPGGPNVRLPYLTLFWTAAFHPKPGLPRTQRRVCLQSVHPRDGLGGRREPERGLRAGSRGHSRQGLA
jgi:hypothetical protein